MHTHLHRLNTLKDASNTCVTKFKSVFPPFFGYTYGTISLLDRVISIINKNNDQLSCPSPQQVQFTAGTWASVLSNATISMYDTSKMYIPIAITDEKWKG